LIQQHDSLRCPTVRKVQKESSTGSSSSEKMRITLTVTVEAVQFDPDSGALRVKGRNITENEFVKMNAYHTLDLEANRKFTLKKPCWDSVALEMLEEACDPKNKADVGAVVMEEGLASVLLLTSSMSLVRAKIETGIPRKRGAAMAHGAHDKAMEKFFEAVLQAVLRHFDFSIIKVAVIASPGFVKEQFMKYIFDQAAKRDLRALLDNRQRFMCVHSSSGHKRALRDALEDPALQSKLVETKAVNEIKVLADFYQILGEDPDRAFYGTNHVMLANEQGAIQTLMITDSLFRNRDIGKRKMYVDLVEAVKANGGEVRIYSSLHVTGEQLAQLGGVAAILRFGIPDLDGDDDDDEEEEAAVPVAGFGNDDGFGDTF